MVVRPDGTVVRVGIVGVGQMGSPIAAKVSSAGHVVVFHARRAEVAEQVTALGGIDAHSLKGVGEASDVVIVCVYSDDQVVDVCLDADGLIGAMAPGSTLVNHTTGSPTTVAMLAAEASPRGVRVLNAALSGGPADIAKGTLTLLVGGDAGVLEDVTRVLASYADPILHVGKLGDGQRIKLLNNAIFGAKVALTAEVERLAADLGVDPVVALDAISHCSGDSYALRAIISLGSSARMQEVAGRFIRKDVAMVNQIAGELGIDLGLLGAVASSPGRSE